MTVAENQFESLRLELRRGSLTLAVLAQLRAEHYGYTLRKDLAERGLEIDESTLYPLLRRLETQGLLVSQWREEDKRNKRFYRLSPDGEQILAKLLEEWQAINTSLCVKFNRALPANSIGRCTSYFIGVTVASVLVSDREKSWRAWV